LDTPYIPTPKYIIQEARPETPSILEVVIPSTIIRKESEELIDSILLEYLPDNYIDEEDCEIDYQIGKAEQWADF